MGVFKMFSSSSLPNQPTITNNPNPYNFTILKKFDMRTYCAIMVKYPDCTNYEGIKILVFKEHISTILKQIVLDPHFTDKPGNYCVPIARFAPNEEGWQDAKIYAYNKYYGDSLEWEKELTQNLKE